MQLLHPNASEAETTLLTDLLYSMYWPKALEY